LSTLKVTHHSTKTRKKKRELYRFAFKTKAEEDKVAYNMAKQEGKKAVAKEKEGECERFADMLNEDERCKKIVKQVT